MNTARDNSTRRQAAAGLWVLWLLMVCIDGFLWGRNGESEPFAMLMILMVVSVLGVLVGAASAVASVAPGVCLRRLLVGTLLGFLASRIGFNTLGVVSEDMGILDPFIFLIVLGIPIGAGALGAQTAARLRKLLTQQVDQPSRPES